MLNDFEKVKKVARGGKFKRLLNRPFEYFFGLFYRKIVYPISFSEKQVATNTFWNESFIINLPASLDIYITGAKTHDSELRLTNFLIKSLKPGSTFIDVGAHFGFYTLLSAKLVGENGQVHAFEASPTIFEVLKRNVAKFKNVTINQAACSNKNGMLKFYDFPILYSEYNSTNINQYQNSKWLNNFKPKEIEVKTVSIDGLKLSPDFIKIDVEGAEKLVVEGLKDTLKNYPKVQIALEYLANDETSNYKETTQILEEAGFYPHIILDDASLKPIKSKEISSYLNTKDLDSDNLIFKKLSV